MIDSYSNLADDENDPQNQLLNIAVESAQPGKYDISTTDLENNFPAIWAAAKNVEMEKMIDSLMDEFEKNDLPFKECAEKAKKITRKHFSEKSEWRVIVANRVSKSIATVFIK